MNEKIEKLNNVYDRFFHAVCKNSCVYTESQADHLGCCDWSILIDDFDRVRKEIADEIAYWIGEYENLFMEIANSEWIPVSERYPDEGEKVLIVDTRGRILTREYTNNGDWCDENCDYWIEHNHVTHWMPLPEPPESERE